MRIKVEEAAQILQVTPQFLRLGLQQNRFPFGVAVWSGKQYSYYINRDKLFEWLGREEVTP